MKLSLARMVRQPIAVMRHTYKVFKHVELVPMVKVGEKTSADTDNAKTGFVVIGSLAIPALAWNMIKDSCVKVDSNYINGQAMWKLPKDQAIYKKHITDDEMIALRVTQRFEEAA